MSRPFPTGPSDYPVDASSRDAWVLARRGNRQDVDVWQPQAVFQEDEPADGAGSVKAVLTVILTSRECPWRCLMCDLWRHTTPGPVPQGAIPAQLERALGQIAAGPLPPVIKLYNSGSFFDPMAVPPADYLGIARRLAGFERVILESHPAFVRRGLRQFQAALAEATPTPPRIEVAMGLETVHPEALDRLNKRMTLTAFRAATAFARESAADVRAFVLLRPPFVPEEEAVGWAVRSVAFAFECGVSVVSIIPTRQGNGALEALAATGAFAEPRLTQLEEALEAAQALQQGRVFADTWDLERFSDCAVCLPVRRQRLVEMNRMQRFVPPVACRACTRRQAH
ncbi:MAG: radical SAM protein [Verrucomicrobiales bacterium]|nr:radical SAM protein [Verrucomicrobiales bacterium]